MLVVPYEQIIKHLRVKDPGERSWYFQTKPLVASVTLKRTPRISIDQFAPFASGVAKKFWESRESVNCNHFGICPNTRLI